LIPLEKDDQCMGAVCDALTRAGVLFVALGLWLLHPSAALIFVGLVCAALGLWGSWAIARHRGSNMADSWERPRVAPLEANDPSDG
jgi:hypothetical protein